MGFSWNVVVTLLGFRRPLCRFGDYADENSNKKKKKKNLKILIETITYEVITVY